MGVRGVGGVGIRRMRGGGARFEEEDGCEIIIKFLVINLHSCGHRPNSSVG